MRIFISHASEQEAIAEELAARLNGEGYKTFQNSLAAGEAIDKGIRNELKRSDVFVFLISPESVSESRYTLSELELAAEKWRRPTGAVLPVMIKETPVEDIPKYLSGVEYLRPKGNVYAEVSAAIERLTKRSYEELYRPQIDMALVGGLGLLIPVGTAFYKNLSFEQSLWFVASAVASLVLAGIIVIWLAGCRRAWSTSRLKGKIVLLARPLAVMLLVAGLAVSACVTVNRPSDDMLEALELRQILIDSFSQYRIAIIGRIKRHMKEDHIPEDSELRYQIIRYTPGAQEQIYKQIQPAGGKPTIVDGIDPGDYSVRLVFYGLMLDESSRFSIGERISYVINLAVPGHDVPVFFSIRDTAGRSMEGVWVQVAGPYDQAFRGAPGYSITDRHGVTKRGLWLPPLSTKERRGYTAKIFSGDLLLGRQNFRVEGATEFFERRTIELVVREETKQGDGQ